MSDVLITEDVWGEPFAALAADFDVRREPDLWQWPAELIRAVATTRAVVVRNRTQVDKALLDAAPRLAVVARAGVGLDNIDLVSAAERDVVVVAPLGANAISVAEHTLGLALDLARRISQLDRAARRGEWSRVAGIELAGRTWGLLGAGATGMAVAERARAMGMRVVAHDPRVSRGVDLVALDDLFRHSDVVSVHVPATDATRGMIDVRLLSLMRPDSLLINVGRGEVVDEGALLPALRAGRPAGAALDVRAEEPPQAGELETLDNVVLTPHVAGITAESQARIASALAHDIRAVLTGGVPTGAVDARAAS
jgi:D-3-phosphoglycerate dehydrogenase/(S)-sulfolactate dehydrogenase